MMLKQTMCIGGLCEGHIFSDMLNIRTRGPVDNFIAYNFKSTLDLFNGNLFDAILTDNIINKEKRETYNSDVDDDQYQRYYCIRDGHWSWNTIHNNFERNDRKELFKKRINTFNDFKNKLNNENFYLYTISINDEYLSENDFKYTIDHLPYYVINNLIVITGARYRIPKMFYEKFKCIDWNFDITGCILPNVRWVI